MVKTLVVPELRQRKAYATRRDEFAARLGRTQNLRHDLAVFLPPNLNAKEDGMGKGRLEAFSDGVIAVIITIMVLELKVPHGAELTDLVELAPVFFSYVLSYLYVGIYWNNHHHMLHTVKRVSGSILWANLHLLFWLSLIPFTTAWMAEHNCASKPTALYGGVLLMASIAWTIMQA